MEKINYSQLENQIKTLHTDKNNKTIWEKLAYHEVNSEGKVINPFLISIDSDLIKKYKVKTVFNTLEEYNDYSSSIINNLKNQLKENLTPS